MKFGFLLVVILCLGLISIVSAQSSPSGAEITIFANSSSSNFSANPGNDSRAYSGNITSLTISGSSNSLTWQGYYGNVSGSIGLEDASGNTLYNWSIAEPSGEVYASTNSSIVWGNIQCFNFTARGNYNSPSGEAGGSTNLNGTNLSILETSFGLLSTSGDGVNETFTLSGAGTHDSFFTAGKSFSEGECPNTRLFSSGATSVPDQFEEALLYEPVSSSVVFASILEPTSVNGFSGADSDFEMLVLENGRDDSLPTTYYFFVELA